MVNEKCQNIAEKPMNEIMRPMPEILATTLSIYENKTKANAEAMVIGRDIANE